MQGKEEIEDRGKKKGNKETKKEDREKNSKGRKRYIYKIHTYI